MSVPAPTTVFIITHEFHPKRGGIATFTEEVARAGAALGHTIEIWAQNAGETTAGGEKPWPFAVRRLPMQGTHDLRCRLVLARYLIRERRRLRRATVYLSEPGPMLAMMMLLPWRALRPRRLVLTFHGSEILRFHADPVTRLLTRRLIRHAFRISVLTGYTQRLLCERFPEAADKTFLTPGALRAGFAPGSVAPAPPARAGDKIVVLTVGRLHPRKGQLFTLEALQSLPPALRDRVEYWIVGTSSKPHYEQTLRAAANRPGLAVRFLGEQSDERLEVLYAQADIFALTSIDHGHSVEGFGLVYLEAAAHGLPVVAHRVGGVAEAVADGETGLLVPPHHPARLTEAFRELIENAPLRQRLGAAGREWARRHTWSRAAELLFHPGDELPDDAEPV